MAFEVEGEVEQNKKSKYNSGVAKEIRRNDLWKETNLHSRNGLFIKWNEDLDTIWSELCADIKPEEFDNKQKEFNEFDKAIKEIGNIQDKMNKGFDEADKDFLDKRDKHYKKLREKEIFLRRLENSLGKGTAYEDDDEDSF
jgi:hypothetical protein